MRNLVMGSVIVLLASLGLAPLGADVERTGPGRLASQAPVDDSTETYTESIPNTLVEFDMVRVPGGSVTVDGEETTVDAFWMAATEVRWEAYDTYRFDEEMKGLDDAEVDAVSLPSKPYGFGNEIPGFGQEKYPALAVTRNAAQQYARWLSAKTDHAYRLPTPAEWKHACHLGYGSPQDWGADRLGERAWFRGNSEEKAHPAASLMSSDLGIYDQLGNAAEHVVSLDAGEDSTPVVWGGSYQSTVDETHCLAHQQKTPAWQESDPQLPKSQWWLSDAPFVGFRVVRAVGN